MKKMGIIGGAGPLASSLLYESVVRECYRQGGDIPEIFLLNFPFTRCLTKQEEASNSTRVLEELGYCIKVLEGHNVEVALLACNTMHLFLKMLPKSKMNFAALPEIVLASAKKDKAQRLLFLGSQNSCRMGLYDDPDVEITYPSKEGQKAVDRAIDQVLRGEISCVDSCSIGQLIEQESLEQTFDGVILGCTDLPVLHHHHPINSSYPLYDSIKIASTSIRGLL